jgi:hypothetical protein
MSGIRNVVLVMVCLGSILLAGHSAAQDSRPGAVVSGISVTREESASPHLQMEVCGTDATRLRHGFPLVVEMSETVRGVVVRNRDAGMAVGTTVEGRRATVTLTRDPFVPQSPGGWSFS